MVWEYALTIGIVVGVVLGFLIARFTGAGAQQKALRQELDQTREELEQYRSGISEHFKRSSVLLNNMIKEYSQLYTHFSKASHELSGDKTGVNPFDFRIVDGSSKVVNEQDGKVVVDDLIKEHTVSESADKKAPETVNTAKQPPRDYSEGASGLFGAQRKE